MSGIELLCSSHLNILRKEEDGYIFGYTDTEEKFRTFMKMIDSMTNGFVTRSSANREQPMPSPDGRTEKKWQKLVWQSCRKHCRLDISDFGSPFVSDEIKYMQCAHGGEKQIRKLSAQQLAKENDVQFHANLKRKRFRLHDTKKFGCGAELLVRRITYYPDFSVDNQNQSLSVRTQKKHSLEELRKALADNSQTVKSIDRYYLLVPTENVHSSHPERREEISELEEIMLYLPSYASLSSAIVSYESETITKYNIVRESKSFSTDVTLREVLAENASPIIRWQDNQPRDNFSIPFSGHPYICLGRRDYQCHQGKDYNVSRKQIQKKKNAYAKLGDHVYVKPRKLSQPTKKMNCPVVFSVKKIILFPHMILEDDSKNNRYAASQVLKESFKLYIDTKDQQLGELQYIVRFPTQQTHQFHQTGDDAGNRVPLDIRVEEFMKEEIMKGCDNVNELEGRCTHFVRTNFLGYTDNPDFCHKRYHPTHERIRNLINSVKLKLQHNSNVDTHNDHHLEEKWQDWGDILYEPLKKEIRLKEVSDSDDDDDDDDDVNSDGGECREFDEEAELSKKIEFCQDNVRKKLEYLYNLSFIDNQDVLEGMSSHLDECIVSLLHKIQPTAELSEMQTFAGEREEQPPDVALFKVIGSEGTE